MPILGRDQFEMRLSAQDIAQLADLDGNGAETAGAVSAALADAEAEVLGYVMSVAALPLPDPAPELLKRLVCDVARYNLYQRHLPEEHPVTVAYLRAVATLRDIASGRLRLSLGGGDQVGSVGVAAGWAPARVMTDAALQGMGP